jgi:hypothetical protein
MAVDTSVEPVERSRHMTRLRVALALVVPALILAWAPSAAALTSDNLNVKVPFAFVAGQSLLPAGQYHVKAIDKNPSTVWLVDSSGRHVANVVTDWGGSPFTGDHAKLLFKVYGHTRFLSGVLIPGENGRVVALTPSQVGTELGHLAAVRAGERARARS